MRRSILRAVLLTGLLVWPILALADVPPNATGLSAHFANGQVTVHWDPSGTTDEIGSYQIYYGEKSILSNNGVYDDFVTTTGKNTEFILTDLPPYKQVYVAVLAVNKAGAESASFVEEVQIDLTNGDVDGQKTLVPPDNSEQAPSPSRKQREATTVGLVGAEADSQATLQLNFSTPVHIPVDQAPQAFTVIDNMGDVLQLRRIIITGNAVTLLTDPQFPGRPYAIRVDSVVTGEPTPGAALPMDDQRSIATFKGFDGPGATAPTVGAATAPLAASVISGSPHVASRGLFRSGAPIVGIMLFSGGIAVWRRSQRRKGSAFHA